MRQGDMAPVTWPGKADVDMRLSGLWGFKRGTPRRSLSRDDKDKCGSAFGFHGLRFPDLEGMRLVHRRGFRVCLRVNADGGSFFFKGVGHV